MHELQNMIYRSQELFFHDSQNSKFKILHNVFQAYRFLKIRSIFFRDIKIIIVMPQGFDSVKTECSLLGPQKIKCHYVNLLCGKNALSRVLNLQKYSLQLVMKKGLQKLATKLHNITILSLALENVDRYNCYDVSRTLVDNLCWRQINFEF